MAPDRSGRRSRPVVCTLRTLELFELLNFELLAVPPVAPRVESRHGLARPTRSASERPGRLDGDDHAGRAQISACGALIFSTSTRMGRVVDRVRVAVGAVREPRQAARAGRHVPGAASAHLLSARPPDVPRAPAAARDVVRSTSRSASSSPPASPSPSSRRWPGTTPGLPSVLGLFGAFFMFYASVLLVLESRMALVAIMSEMDFVWKVSTEVRREGAEREVRGRTVHVAGRKSGCRAPANLRHPAAWRSDRLRALRAGIQRRAARPGQDVAEAIVKVTDRRAGPIEQRRHASRREPRGGKAHPTATALRHALTEHHASQIRGAAPSAARTPSSRVTGRHRNAIAPTYRPPRAATP